MCHLLKLLSTLFQREGIVQFSTFGYILQNFFITYYISASSMARGTGVGNGTNQE